MLGFWSISDNVGNALGSTVAAYVIDDLGLNWGWAMQIVAGYTLLNAVVIFVFLQPYPEMVGLVVKEYDDPEEEDGTHNSSNSMKDKFLERTVW